MNCGAASFLFSRSHTNVLWSLSVCMSVERKIIKYVWWCWCYKYEEMILEAKKKIKKLCEEISVELSNTSRSKEIADELMILFSYKSHWHTFQLLYYNRSSKYIYYYYLVLSYYFYYYNKSSSFVIEIANVQRSLWLVIFLNLCVYFYFYIRGQFKCCAY